MHYSYMADLPEVRQILRSNGLADIRSERLNRKGQLPRQLRHFQKVENSSEEDEEDDFDKIEEKEAKLDNELCIIGNKAELHESQANASIDAEEQVEAFIEGRKDFDVHDRADKYRLMNNPDLTMKQKIAHFRSPDYCLVTRSDTVYLLLAQLSSLVARGGVYYSVYDFIEK